MAVARVELPRVLAIQGDDREVVVIVLLLADAPQARHQVSRRVGRRHALVVEADQVRERRVPEDHRHRLAFAVDAVRPVKLRRHVHPALRVAPDVRVDGAGQHLFVADHPVDAGAHRQPGHTLADRHLRRPHPTWPPADQALEQPLPQLDLPLRVLAVREVPLGELDLRVRRARRVDVAQQREDRMVIRREGQLGLPPVGQLPVLRDDLGHDLGLGFEQRLFVPLREVAILPLKLGQARIGIDPYRVAPREVEPDLEVADLLGAELLVERA